MHILSEEGRQPGGDTRPQYCLWVCLWGTHQAAWAAPILSALPLLLQELSAHLGFDYAGTNPALGTGCCCLCPPLSHTWLHQAPGWPLLKRCSRSPNEQNSG